MKTDPFKSCGFYWVFHICWHIECSTFTASSFRIGNCSTGIPSPPLAMCIVIIPKYLLDFAFQDVWLLVGDHTIMVIWVMIFFAQFCVFFPPLLNIFCFFRSIPFLSFIVPIFSWKVLLVSLIFLKRSLVFSIILFPLFLCIDHWGRLPYLSFLFLWNSAFRCVYLSFSPCLSHLFFSQLFVRPP